MGIERERLKVALTHAARLLAMPQPKVSLLLRGQFRGISEAKMLECPARLGRTLTSWSSPHAAGPWRARLGR
jgi:predicted XRE-type DNA-binding protein